MFKYLYAIAVLLAVQAAVPNPPKPAIAKPDFSQEAFVDEQDLTRIAFENDGTSTREDSVRLRIQSEAGVQRYGVLTFAYQNATEAVDIDYVRVTKPDGTVVVTPPDNVQDMAAAITREAPFYSDLREKHVAVKGLSVGDILESKAHWHSTKPLAPGQFWYGFNFPHDFIILHLEVQISVPRERAVKWKSPSVQPVITETGDRRIFSWTSSQLEHKSSDQEKKDQEATTYQTARGKLPAPDVEISTFQSWDEVGRWYNSLQLDRVKPSDEIRAKAAELTRNATTEDAKLHVIYDYVATQVHYIGVAFGIGRYQPHSAADVLSNQYGDCKDKHTLLASLLAAAGIKAYPVLINTFHQLDPDVPSPMQFDHVITAVPQGNGYLWLDTTAEVAPFGYLIGVLRDKAALVIPTETVASLVNTPDNPPSQGLETFKVNATLKDDGTLQGKVERIISGDDVTVLLRGAFRRLPMPQWKDLVQQISYNSGFAGDVSDVSVSPPEKTEEPLKINYSYDRKDYPQWSERRVSSPLPPMIGPPPDTKPSQPIFLGPLEEFRNESNVVLPSGYSPELPGKIDLKEDFAAYHATYSFKDGVLHTERSLTVKLREIPLTEYEAYKKFAKAVNDDHERYVPLSNGTRSREVATVSSLQDALRQLPDSTNAGALELEVDAKSELQRGDSKAAIESLRGAVAADDKFARAWVLLATVLLATQQSDDGIDAFRKAIAADPVKPVIYKAFAYSLMSLKRFEQAVPVWQKEIELAPDDSEGPANLGTAYLSMKRYSEAVPALQSAVKLNSQSVGLLMGLATAYLYTDDAKTIATFESALSLDQRPGIFNDIAYTMAEAGRQLPTALKYAIKAVSEEEHTSNEISLATLKKEDLARMSNLAAYWDTLGWVYFKMADLEQAERYLNAAWILSQDGVVATHLGQVYEHQNKKEAAIRMYRLGQYRLTFGAAPLVSRENEQEKETRALLEHLSPGMANKLGGTDVSDILTQMRTFKLPRLLPGTVAAEMFLLLDQASKVEDVKLISGPEDLVSLVKKLGSAGPNLKLPAEASVRMVRRGFIDCYPASGCVLVLLNPIDVHSVN